MIDRLANRFPSAVLARSRYPAAGFVIGAIVLALSWTPWAVSDGVRFAIFYGAVCAAYGLMPLARRGDIPLVAAWVVLLSAIAPCTLGQLLSPRHVAIDSLGVLAAAAPIYIARLRQVRQGDIGASQKRAMARRISDADFSRGWASTDAVEAGV